MSKTPNIIMMLDVPITADGSIKIHLEEVGLDYEAEPNVASGDEQVTVHAVYLQNGGMDWVQISEMLDSPVALLLADKIRHTINDQDQDDIVMMYERAGLHLDVTADPQVCDYWRVA